jgi:site-specific recombinase XerD
MLYHYYQSKTVINKLRTGPGGTYLDQFAVALCEADYSEITARRHIRTAQHLAYWAQSKQIPLSGMHDALIESFKRHLRQCQCPTFGCYNQKGLIRGSILFLKLLRHINVIPYHADDIGSATQASSLLASFVEWIRHNRNLGASTVYNYSFAVRDFVEFMGADPCRYDAQGLRRFFLNQNECCGRAKTKMMATALRAFVRFLISEGFCPLGLEAAIPTIAHWQLSNLPRYLQADEVERIIAASDIGTAVGLRNKAIILLLARLALRASDVVHLQLDDIDWSDGWIRFCGKGRHEGRLPLPQEVGEAIVAYVTGCRPSVDSRRLFLRFRAPIRGFTSSCSISAIVTQAMHKAGVVCSTSGAAHLLRHSAATAMLRAGASLQDISVVLRHRSIQTTLIYAKTDVVALRDIAQPWPEEVEPC